MVSNVKRHGIRGTKIVKLDKKGESEADKKLSKKRKRPTEPPPTATDFINAVEGALPTGVSLGHRSKRRLTSLAESGGLSADRARSVTMVEGLKRMWEHLRSPKCPKEEKPQHVAKMLDLSSGKVKEFVHKHDGSRVIQSMLTCGTKEQRLTIHKELKGDYLTLASSQYGHFLVIKVLAECKESREDIFGEILPSVNKVIRTGPGGRVVDQFYQEFMNASQKKRVLQKFYLSKTQAASAEPEYLDQYLKANPEKKASVVQNLKLQLGPLIEKGKIGELTFIHELLHRYLMSEPDLEEDMVKELNQQVHEIVHTHHGSRVAIWLIRRAGAKERKQMLKLFKMHFVKTADISPAHLVLVEFLRVTDDTQIVAETLLKEIKRELKTVVTSVNGAKVITDGLLVPPGPEAADSQPATSKKDPAKRRRELLQPFLTGLLATLADQEVIQSCLCHENKRKLLQMSMGCLKKPDSKRPNDRTEMEVQEHLEEDEPLLAKDLDEMRESIAEILVKITIAKTSTKEDPNHPLASKGNCNLIAKLIKSDAGGLTEKWLEEVSSKQQVSEALDAWPFTKNIFLALTDIVENDKEKVEWFEYTRTLVEAMRPRASN